MTAPTQPNQVVPKLYYPKAYFDNLAAQRDIRSEAQMASFLSPEEQEVLGRDASTIVRGSLLGSAALGSYPDAFTAEQWRREVSFNSTTFEPLTEAQARAVLAVGVRIGILKQHRSYYSVHGSEVGAAMLALFDQESLRLSPSHQREMNAYRQGQATGESGYPSANVALRSSNSTAASVPSAAGLTPAVAR